VGGPVKRAHPFRFKRVNRKDGKVYLVVYDIDPAHPVSSGIAVDPADTADGGPGYQEAISWAYANMGTATRPRALLKDVAADMFSEECGWRRRVQAKGRKFGSQYFKAHRSRLTSYIIPRWGHYQPANVKPAQIDDWLLGLESTHHGRPLTAHALNKIVQTFRIVMDEIEYQGILAQGQNPARLVTYFTDDEQKRDPITMDEFKKLFPEDMDELVRIWGTLSWSTFFYIMATTGMRPGEVAAMDLAFWIKGVGYPVSQAIEPDTREIKGLKTAERGVTVKPAYLNDRAEALITMVVYQGAPQSGLLFPGEDGRGMPPDTSNKHFKASCARVRPDPIELARRTQYSLRHFFSTTIAKHLTEREAATYLGQRTYRGEYDHRQVVEKLKTDERMRRLSNEIF
jgi:integrase